MASRTAWAGTATTEVFDVADANSLPGGWIGFVEATANQGSITTLVDLTGLSQAVTVGTNRKIRIQFHLPRALSTTANDTWRIYIREGATVLQSMTGSNNQASVAESGGTMTRILNPSSGSHTYKVSAERVGGSGTISVAASADDPMQLLIEDIGPSS